MSNIDIEDVGDLVHINDKQNANEKYMNLTYSSFKIIHRLPRKLPYI